MSLKLWLEKGWLKEYKPTSREIAELLAVADRSLKDCQVAGLSNEGKLDMAHNAALQSSAAALAAAGYRASREAYHYYVIQSLFFTLQLEERIIRRLINYALNGILATTNARVWLQSRKPRRWLNWQN